MWMTDATPVPCGLSRETVTRSDLAGHADYGYCASHSRWYWGLTLYLVCTGDGMPIMGCLANPKIGERQVLAAVLDHHLIRDGQILVAEEGFSGTPFTQLTEETGLNLLPPTARTRPTATTTSVACANGEDPILGRHAPPTHLVGRLCLEWHPSDEAACSALVASRWWHCRYMPAASTGFPGTAGRVVVRSTGAPRGVVVSPVLAADRSSSLRSTALAAMVVCPP
jgi:hypothetical protein